MKEFYCPCCGCSSGKAGKCEEEECECFDKPLKSKGKTAAKKN